MSVSVNSVSVSAKREANIKRVEDLEVFKRSHELTLKLYKITEIFSQNERFGLIPQIRRAASSIGANLMEGGHRLSRKEFRQFTSIAKGSAGELKYHMLLSKDLGYISIDDYNFIINELEEISKMLNGLIRSLSLSTDTKH